MKYLIISITLILYATHSYCQLNSAIFNGGIGDGWSYNNYQQPEHNIFNGGTSDGWANASYQQPELNIFNGGIGDGWAHYDTSFWYVGIEEENFKSKIVAYPNPTNGNLNLDLGLSYKTVDIDICNSLGQIISQIKFGNTAFISIDIPGKKELYFIRLKSGNESATIKVLKE